MAALISLPVSNLNVPAVLVAVGAYVFKSSWLENLTNIGSCVEALPIVVSVPRWNKCLSLSETIVILVAVGLLVVLKLVVVCEALTALGLDAPASQVNVLPLNIVATNTSPKLSRLQFPGARTTLLVDRSVPQVESPHKYVPQP